jgi:flagellin
VRIAISLLALTAACYGDNIVLNGGFETGDLTGWTVNSLEDSWSISSVANTGLFAVTTGCVGDTCINGDPASQNFLTQTLLTNPGDSYTLSFWYDPGSVGAGEGNTSELMILWGGVQVDDLLLIGTGGSDGGPVVTLTTPDPGYNQYTYSLIATSTSTDLTFLGRQDPSFSFLDDISVTDTSLPSSAPEPSSYLTAAGGILILGAMRMRARRA